MAGKLEELFQRAKAENRPVFWDGAMGTQLIARGLVGKAPEWWNLEKPQEIEAIHRDYVLAGAEVIQTNTFGGNRLKLKGAGLEDKVRQVNLRAGEIAKKASGDRALVAGDIGPTGEMMSPMGSLTPQQAEEVFAEQAEALLSAGVDLFSIETMFDLEEACSAIRAVKKLAKEVPIVAHMTFRKTPRGFFTIMGITPEQAIDKMLEAGAMVVGSNCTIGPSEMVELIEIMRAHTSAFLIAQPNAGSPRLEEEKEVYEYQAEEFAEFAPRLFQAGANAIGACCGSSPEFIKLIREKFSG